MSGCGNCQCGDGRDKSVAQDTCATNEKTVVLDKGGKCPCGKSAEDCCHKDKLKKADANEALDELCTPHGGKNTC